MTTTAPADVGDLLRSFKGDPQRAQDLARFLGFDPIPNPQDQLAGASTTTLAQFFRSRDDRFGVSQLYRVGTCDADPATAGLWIAVLSEWSHRSSDRDRTRRRISRALVELTTDRRNLAMLVPPAGSDANEAELIFPRTASTDAETTSQQSITSIRALIDLDDPTRFHRDLLRDLAIPDGADLLQISRRWQEQFSVERVANRFYQEYADVRNRIATALVEANHDHTVVASLTQQETRAWATRQMGRVLFLWFLQAKRWLGESRGNGSPTYLRDLWNRRSDAPDNEYYRGVLVPLFFDAMATGNSTNGQHPLLGYVPYLNGGLFRRDPLEYRIDDAGKVSLPDDVFDPTSNDSLLGLLSRYRFTTRESTPDDQSVDPDPELLGRVFENLYQGDEKHDTGTYYTPREIVHFMCRQALDGYLKDSVPGLQQPTLDNLRDIATGSQDDTHTVNLDARTSEQIVDALETVRVCDPAVGSGAFLLGTTQEIVLLRRGILFTERVQVSPEELDNAVSEWKQRIITYNLHGVDINPDAVEICRLRLWLSMVLDIPEPPESPSDWSLPNLDFRIVAGDSLVDRLSGIEFKESWPTPKALQISFDLRNDLTRLERTIARRKDEFNRTHRDPLRLRQLRDLIDRDQREVVRLHLTHGLTTAENELQLRKGIKTGPNNEKRAQDRVDQLQSLLIKLEQTDHALVQKPFLWPLAFPDVLNDTDPESGFDIVLANPPYVRMEKLDNLDEESYAQTFPQVRAPRADLLVYFYARALQILRPSGRIAFITSNSFTKRKYGAPLRRHLTETLSIETIIDFGETPIFDATVEPYVLVGHKTKSESSSDISGHNLYPVLTRRLKGQSGIEPIREEIQQLPYHLESEVSEFPQSRLTSAEWRIEDEAINRLFERLINLGTPLGHLVNDRLYMGAKTGLNKAFVITQAQRDDLIAQDDRNSGVIKPWLRGRDITRWNTKPSGLYIIFTHRGFDIASYPTLEHYLAQFRPQLERRATSHLHPWYEFQQPQQGIYHEFGQPKIIWQDIARQLRFAHDTSGAYLDMTCFTIPSTVSI